MSDYRLNPRPPEPRDPFAMLKAPVVPFGNPFRSARVAIDEAEASPEDSAAFISMSQRRGRRRRSRPESPSGASQSSGGSSGSAGSGSPALSSAPPSPLAEDEGFDMMAAADRASDADAEANKQADALDALPLSDDGDSGMDYSGENGMESMVVDAGAAAGAVDGDGSYRSSPSLSRCSTVGCGRRSRGMYAGRPKVPYQ